VDPLLGPSEPETTQVTVDAKEDGMRDQTRRLRAPIRALTVAAGLGAALASAAPALAELPAFGMTTVARRQTATMHGVLTEPVPAGTPSCQVEATFVDAQGAVLNDAAGVPIRAQWDLQSGVAQSLSVRMSDILPAGQARKLIRAAVRETSPVPSAACCSLTLTLEVMSGLGGMSYVALPRWPNPPSPFCVESR
jgi:hypothetical protein